MQLRWTTAIQTEIAASSTRLRKTDKEASYVLRRTNMIINYLFFQKGHGPHDRNRFARFPFGSGLKIDYASEALPVSRTPAPDRQRTRNSQNPLRAEIFRPIWSLVRHGTELIAGLLAVIYLIVVLALAGALLFFTFAH